MSLQRDLDRFNAAFGCRGHLPLQSPEEEAVEMIAHAREMADVDRALYRDRVFRLMMLAGEPRAYAYERASTRGADDHPRLHVDGSLLRRLSYGPGAWYAYPAPDSVVRVMERILG